MQGFFFPWECNPYDLSSTAGFFDKLIDPVLEEQGIQVQPFSGQLNAIVCEPGFEVALVVWELRIYSLFV